MAGALVDYFLKIEGIEGESLDDKHKNEIQLESWSWGATNQGAFGTTAGGGSGKVQMQDFHFVMQHNKASPKLMLACASGEHIKSALLTCRKAGKEQQEFLKIKFTDLVISSYQTGGTGQNNALPMDSISFNYAQIDKEYAPQGNDGKLQGPIKAGWNVQKNKAS